MTPSVDTDDTAGPPPSDGLSLVGETKRFLKDWQRVLLGPSEWVPDQVAALRQRARDLESRARAARVTGLAQHLRACEQCFESGEVDLAKLTHGLRNVSEVAWQWRQDLRIRSDVSAIEVQGHVSRERLTIEPPALLAPPSVEAFESSPPPPSPEASSEWPELPDSSWPERSGLRGWLGASPQREAEPASGPPPRSKRKGPLAFPSLADLADDVAPDAAPDSGPPEASSSEAAPPPASGFPWRSALLGALGIASIAGLGVLVSALGGGPSEAAGSAALALDPGSRTPGAVGPALTRDAVERMLADAHGYGGIEPPELARLLDAEAAELASSGGACVPGAHGCGSIRTSSLSPLAGPGPRSGPGERGRWLEGLELPELGVEDDPRVRQAFEFHTRNAVGREKFQELLFRCGVYRELVHGALQRYGLPLELLALPMASSGCVPDAEAARGGRGLWSLTPAAARAYQLRVKARVVDERIDPVKATDASVRLLDDLYRKTGSWALAIAAYRLGPLELLSRLRAAGDGASYWALDDAGGVPPEAARLVPEVQAFALVLANLAKFRFEPAAPPEPEGTAALEVPPGTRLGLVARAAASSTSKIRELNPGVLGDHVPDWPGERFVLRVPKEGGERAREALPELIATADHADECVPFAFDWGRHRFTTAMASRCEQSSRSR